MMNGFEDIQKTGRENVGKAMDSLGAMSRGVQAIASETVDYSKRSFEKSASHVEALVGAKSLDRAVEVQSEYVRAAYEDTMGQMSRLGELYADLARAFFKPYEGLFPAASR